MNISGSLLMIDALPIEEELVLVRQNNNYISGLRSTVPQKMMILSKLRQVAPKR
jgi:hypothetical protein